MLVMLQRRKVMASEQEYNKADKQLIVDGRVMVSNTLTVKRISLENLAKD